MIERLSALYGRLLELLAGVACLLLFAMVMTICVDVLLRNVALIPSMRGLEWSNDVTEAMLYLITMLAAPWMLRRGQHIRVDIVLQAIPKLTAWYCEWAADVLAFTCCLFMVIYGARSAFESYESGALTIKILITPEWWLLTPLPVTFALLAVEVLFRMRRLLHGQRGPRDDAVSAA